MHRPLTASVSLLFLLLMTMAINVDADPTVTTRDLIVQSGHCDNEDTVCIPSLRRVQLSSQSIDVANVPSNRPNFAFVPLHSTDVINVNPEADNGKGKLYWTDGTLGLFVSNMDGTNVTHLVDTAAQQAQCVTTDGQSFFYAVSTKILNIPLYNFTDANPNTGIPNPSLVLDVEESLKVASPVSSIVWEPNTNRLIFVIIVDIYSCQLPLCDKPKKLGSFPDIPSQSIQVIELDWWLGQLYVFSEGATNIIRTDLALQNRQDFTLPGVKGDVLDMAFDHINKKAFVASTISGVVRCQLSTLDDCQTVFSTSSTQTLSVAFNYRDQSLIMLLRSKTLQQKQIVRMNVTVNGTGTPISIMSESNYRNWADVGIHAPSCNVWLASNTDPTAFFMKASDTLPTPFNISAPNEIKQQEAKVSALVLTSDLNGHQRIVVSKVYPHYTLIVSAPADPTTNHGGPTTVLADSRMFSPTLIQLDPVLGMAYWVSQGRIVQSYITPTLLHSNLSSIAEIPLNPNQMVGDLLLINSHTLVYSRKYIDFSKNVELFSLHVDPSDQFVYQPVKFATMPTNNSLCAIAIGSGQDFYAISEATLWHLMPNASIPMVKFTPMDNTNSLIGCANQLPFGNTLLSFTVQRRTKFNCSDYGFLNVAQAVPTGLQYIQCRLNFVTHQLWHCQVITNVALSLQPLSASLFTKFNPTLPAPFNTSQPDFCFQTPQISFGFGLVVNGTDSVIFPLADSATRSIYPSYETSPDISLPQKTYLNYEEINGIAYASFLVVRQNTILSVPKFRLDGKPSKLTWKLDIHQVLGDVTKIGVSSDNTFLFWASSDINQIFVMILKQEDGMRVPSVYVPDVDSNFAGTFAVEGKFIYTVAQASTSSVGIYKNWIDLTTKMGKKQLFTTITNVNTVPYLYIDSILQRLIVVYLNFQETFVFEFSLADPTSSKDLSSLVKSTELKVNALWSAGDLSHCLPKFSPWNLPVPTMTPILPSSSPTPTASPTPTPSPSTKPNPVRPHNGTHHNDNPFPWDPNPENLWAPILTIALSVTVFAIGIWYLIRYVRPQDPSQQQQGRKTRDQDFPFTTSGFRTLDEFDEDQELQSRVYTSTMVSINNSDPYGRYQFLEDE